MPRGYYKAYYPSPNPLVTIGLTTSTAPSSLSSSSTEPFCIIVTARIISTPHLDRPITLQTHLSPLHGINTRAFDDIICTTDPTKRIKIWPTSWPNYFWNDHDLREIDWPGNCVTIPPLNQGTYSVRHEIPRALIEAANIKKGERYRVTINDRCLGTRWWAFKSLEELEGVRLRVYSAQEIKEGIGEEIPDDGRDKSYGDEPASMGEPPEMLAMIPDGDLEFEVIQ